MSAAIIDDVLPAVTVSHLIVHRGSRTVLQDVNFTLPPGKVVGLIGPSGSGKTTLMRSMVGVQKIVSGDVTIFGNAAGSPTLRSRVGYLTQAPSVYPDITVRQNLAYFATVLGATKSDVDRVIDEVDLKSHANAVVSTLSGGQRARASLAVALLGSPELLVLDEPTVGLDPVLRQKLWALFHELASKGRSLLISSHVMDEAERCDHLLLMRDGKLLAQASPSEIMQQTGADTLENAFITLIKSKGGKP